MLTINIVLLMYYYKTLVQKLEVETKKDKYLVGLL